MAWSALTRRIPWRSVAGRSLSGSLAAALGLQLVLVGSGIVVARSLGAQDRGYMALLVVVSGVCTLVGGMGLFTAATYYIARDLEGARRIVRSLLVPGLLQLVATMVVQAAVVSVLVAHDPRRVHYAGVVSLLLVPGILAYGYGEGILLGQQRFTAFNILRVVPTAAYAALVLAAFVLGVANLVMVMAIWAGANFVGGILALGIAVAGLPKGSSEHPIPSRWTMTKFGLKGLLASLSPIEVFRVDQAVVGLFLNPVALGLYVVAQAFTNLPRAIASSIGYIAYPRVAARSDPAEARRMVWRYFLLGAGVSALIIGATEIAIGKVIPIFFGGEFTAATPIARILLVGTFFSAARRVLTDGMKGLGYPGQGAVAEVTSWALVVAASAILLPRYGASGVAMALTLAWGASLGVALLLAATARGRVSPERVTWAQHVLGRSYARSLPIVVGPRSYVLMGFTAASALAVGAAAATVSPRTALMLAGLLVGVLVFAFGRSALKRRPEWRQKPLASVAPWSDAREQIKSVNLRGARIVYYVGLLLLALLTLRIGGQITFSDVLFLFSMMLACAELVILRRNVPLRIPLLLLLGMAIFTIGGLLSTFQSYAAFKSVAIVMRLIFLTLFWFWLGTVVLTRREHVRKAVVLWIGSAAVCGAGAILQVVAGDVIPNTTPIYGRSTGFTNQPNDLGGLAAIAFIPALMLASRRRLSGVQRTVSYVLLLFVAAGLLLSGSVGALIAAGAATFVWFCFQRSSTHSVLAFGAIIVSAAAILAIQVARGAPTPLDRLNKVTATSSTANGAGSLDSRIATYRVAAKAIRRDPFIGVGLDLVSVTKPFGVVSYEYDVHNLVIGTWYKAGLFGLIGMLLAVLAVLRTGWRAIVRSRSDEEQMAAVSLLSSFVAFVVFAMGAPVLFSRYGWISAALLLALRAVQASESRTAEAPERSMGLPRPTPAPTAGFAPLRP